MQLASRFGRVCWALIRLFQKVDKKQYNPLQFDGYFFENFFFCLRVGPETTGVL